LAESGQEKVWEGWRKSFLFDSVGWDSARRKYRVGILISG